MYFYREEQILLKLSTRVLFRRCIYSPEEVLLSFYYYISWIVYRHIR